MTRFQGTESGIAEGTADTAGAKLDASEYPRHDEQTLEFVLPQELEELHSGSTDLAVVPRLLDDLPVYVPHPARPTVVTGLVVLLLALGEFLLDPIERRRRNGSGIEARSLLGEVVFGELRYSRHAGKDTRCWMQQDRR